MKIAVDIDCMHKIKDGIGVFVRNIYDVLKEKNGEHRYYFFSMPKREKAKKKEGAYIQRIANGILQILWMQIALPSKLCLNKIDVLFSPNFILPLLNPCKVVLVVHDLAVFKFPEDYDYLYKSYIRFFLPICIKRANIIVAPSVFIKNEILTRFSIPSERIRVIREGVNCRFRVVDKQREIAEALKSFNLKDKNYILTVGSIFYRKNMDTLLEAFKFVLAHPGMKDTKLVIVGRYNKFNKRLKATFLKVNQLRLKANVILTGYIPTEELLMLYNGARMFVYPSFYEGFGLPVLEAMACGIPIITSNLSSLPEVAGDAAILVNPYNAKQISDAIISLLSDENLKNELCRKGINRLKQFSWQKTTQDIIKACEEAVNKK